MLLCAGTYHDDINTLSSSRVDSSAVNARGCLYSLGLVETQNADDMQVCRRHV
jgi:hypothetical protein